MAPRPGPTLRRRKLVKKLAEARRAAGLSIRQLAAEMDLQPGTVSKIETGKQGLTVRNIKSIGRVTGLSRTGVDELVLLAADDGTGNEWLSGFRQSLPEWFSLYLALERDADQIWTYCSELVHGLLRTSANTEALTRMSFPRLDDAQLRQAVELGTARQSLLDRDDPPRLRVILNEAVLRRAVGGATALRAQFDHLVRLSKEPDVEIQVLPFGAGAHPGMKGGFTLLRFPSGFDDMDCAYLENENSGVFQERQEDIDRYAGIFERLHDLALTPARSRALLTSLG